MMNPTFLRRGGWLALAVGTATVLFVSCRDFETAFDDCQDAGRCVPDEDYLPDGGVIHHDGGTDGGTTPGNDGGTDGGTTPGNDGGMDGGTTPGNDGGTDGGTTPGNDAGMDAGDEPSVDAGNDAGSDAGMDAGEDAGTDAGDDAGADAGDDGGSDAGPVTADSGTTAPDASMDSTVLNENECTAGLCLRHKYTLTGPYEFQGLWGSGPDDVFLAARARPEVQAPAQVVRFSHGSFSASTVDLPGFQPFRLDGTDPANVVAINEAPVSGPCKPSEEPLDEANASPLLHCLAPLFHFDGKSWTPAGYATRTSWGAWARFPILERTPFVAIAGPDEKNLYAATSSLVLRWTPEQGWRPEVSVPVLDLQPAKVQDLWVSGDGTDVWVTLKTSYVLRKHGGQWSVIQLPVAPGFSALRVRGFDTPAGDLWVTGTWSSGFSFGTEAYHFERQEP